MSVRLTRFMPFVMLAVLPAMAAAQEPTVVSQTLSAGTRFIALPFPTDDGNGTLSIWKMRNERNALGIVVSLGYNRIARDSVAGAEPSFTHADFQAGPAWRRYQRLHPNVAGYGTLGLFARYARTVSTGSTRTEETQWGGGASAGLGAEWFPFERVSLGGSTGLSASFMSGDASGVPQATTSQLALGTFTTAVGVTIYF